MFVTTVQHMYTVSAWEYTAGTNKAPQDKYTNLSHNLKNLLNTKHSLT